MADDLTTTLTSGAIRFTGLGSGTDFDSMVTKLVDVERVTTTRLEKWRAEWEEKSEAFDTLSAAMLSLNTTLSSMNTTDEFLIKSVTSSNSTAMTASATSQAEEGSHVVEIESLATTDMHMGTAIFASANDVISGGSTGTFAFTYGTNQISVDVTATTTLSQFASLINSDPDNRSYVRASVINDGSGYRLQVRGMDLGAGNDFIVDDTLTSASLLTNFGSDKFIETQNASNSQLVVDGWPATPTATADTLTSTITGQTPASVVSASGGTFKFAYAGNIFSVALDAATTYADLATAVNSAVQAKIPTSTFQASATTNASGALEFTLTGDTGSDNQISIVNTPGTTISSLQSGKFSQVLGATDGYIERPTNAVSDVINGVTMTLTKAGETTTLTTGIDTEAITEKVRTFVDGINEVLSLIKEQTQVTTVGEKTSGSILTGNYGVQMIQQNLKNILAQKGQGFDYDMDAVTSLGSLGITTDTNEGSTTFGLLEFDESSFTAALSSDPDAVARLFSADMYPSTKEIVSGVAVESSNFKFDSYIKSVTGAGNFDLSYTVNASGTITSATINGYAASIDGAKIVAMGDGNAAKGLAVEILNLTAGNYSGQVQLKSGKTEELYQEIKKLTASETGTLDILKDNYQDIMDSIDDKIAYEERRLTLLESNLRQRFANLDAVLGTYDNLSTQLSSQISGLSSSS